MSQPSNVTESIFSTSFNSLSSVAQARLLREHIVPFLERISLEEGDREDIEDAIEAAARRQSRFPKSTISTRNEELLQMLVALRRNVKLNPRGDKMEEQNELLLEILHSMLDYVNQLWIIGIEFGEQMDSVHEALLLISKTFTDMNEVAGCNCVINATELSFELKRSDNMVLDKFTGSAITVLRAVLLHVWRHLLLGHLAQPENANDACTFVMYRFPHMLKDICRGHGSGTATLFRLMYGTLPDRAEDTDEEDSETSDEDTEDDDFLPPLIDISDGSGFQEAGDASGTLDKAGEQVESHAESSDSGGSDDSSGDSEDSDSSGISEGITFEIEEEQDLRLAQISRFHTLVNKYLVDKFKDTPNMDDFALIISHEPATRGDLIAHLGTMRHTASTLSEAIRILIFENCAGTLNKLASNHSHLAFQIPESFQDLSLYYVRASRATTRALGPVLILREVRALIRSTRIEVESAFTGLRDRTKRTKIVETLKTPDSAARSEVIKKWVDSILAPKISTSAAQPESPPTNPLDIFTAAFSASFGIPQPADDDWDPVDEIPLSPTDSDYLRILERYRPQLSDAWSGWLSVVSDIAAEDPVKCRPVYVKIWKEIDDAFPFLKSPKTVAEMTSRYPSSRTKGHVCDALDTLSEWVVSQHKALVRAARALAAKNASAKQASNTASSTARNSGATFFNTTPSNLAIPTTPTSTASTVAPMGPTISTSQAGVSVGPIDGNVAPGTTTTPNFAGLMGVYIPASWVWLGGGGGGGDINDDVD